MTRDEALQQPAIHALVEGLIRALGPQLDSVVLYGSAARGDFQARRSDYNVAVVAARLDPPILEALTAPVVDWIKARQPPPRLLTRAIIAASLDVFPVEFLDLRSCHLVLHGTDPFAGLTVHAAALRLQCEREFREKLMRLDEGYLIAHASRRALAALLLDSYTSFTMLFRACLALLGTPQPEAAAEVAAAFCARAGIDPEPFAAVDRLRRGAAPGGRDLKTLFSGYHDALTRAAEALDAFRTHEGGEIR